jgi:hypothetical protein
MKKYTIKSMDNKSKDEILMIKPSLMAKIGENPDRSVGWTASRYCRGLMHRLRLPDPLRLPVTHSQFQ